MIASAKTRPRPKPVYWFAAHSIGLALLIGFWPTPRSAYPELFHAHANALVAQLASPQVRFVAPAPEWTAKGVDTEMIVTAGAGATDALQSWFSVDRIGYWPSAALVAMLLATPLSPLRRALAVAVGLALVDLFTLARIGIEIAYATDQLAHGPGAPVEGAVPLLLRIGSESLTGTIPSAAFVLVCWVITASPWRTIDLAAIRSRR